MANTSSTTDGVSSGLELALSRIGLELQRAALKSEEAVFRVFRGQLSRLGLFCPLLILGEPRGSLWIQEAALPDFLASETSNLLQTAVRDHVFLWSVDRSLSQVIEKGLPVFIADNSALLRNLLPENLEPVRQEVLDLFGEKPAVLAPVAVGDQLYGVLVSSGEIVQPGHLPVWEVFAGLLGTALQAALQKHKGDQLRLPGLSTEQGWKVINALSAVQFGGDHQELQALIEAVPDAVVIKNGQGRWLYANPTGIQLFQLEKIAWQGKTDLELAELLPAMAEIFRDCHQSDRTTWQTGKRYDQIVSFAGGNGASQRVFDARKVPVFDRDGQRVGLVVAGRDITDQKNLEQELRRRAKELEALHALSADIISEHETHVLLKRVVERAANLLCATEGGLYLCTPERNTVRLVVELAASSTVDPGVELNYGEGAAGWVVANGKPLIVDDYSQLEGQAEVYVGQQFTAVLSVPLIWQGQIMGVLQVMADSNVRKFTREDQELLGLFANQAAPAIENARLFDAERSQLLLAQMLQQLAALLTSQSSLDVVLESILDLLGKVVRYDSVSIQLLDKDGMLELSAARGFEDLERVRQIVRALSDHNPQEKWMTREVLVISDTHKSPRWVLYPGSEGIRSWIGAPLLVKGRLIGILNVDSNRVGEYDAAAGEKVMAFANQAATAIENARLFEAAEKRAAELEALRQASLSLTSSLELREVLDAILNSVLRLLPGMRNAHIFLFDEATQKLDFGAALSGDGRHGEMLAQPRPNGLTNTVARRGEPIIVPDMQASAIYRGAPAEWQGAIAGLPLKIGQHVVGVMNISYEKPREFPASEMYLLQLLADQAAIAIENAHLFEQAATERRHLRLLYDVGRAVTASLEPEVILDRAVDLTCLALGGGVGQAFFFESDEQRLRMVALHGRPQILVQNLREKLTVPLGVGLAGWVALHRQPVCLPDVTQDERWFFIEEVDHDIHAALTVPILSGDRLLGVISVLHQQAGVFTNQHLDLLLAVCREIGLALSNAERYQQVQRRLTEISLIQNLAETLNQRHELQDLLDEVVNQLAETFGYPQVRISLIEADHLALRAYSGPAPEIDQIPLSSGISGRAARTGEIVFVPDVSCEPDYLACVAGTRSALAVPIFSGQAVIGVINIETDSPEQLDVRDLGVIQVLADQISIAIENAVLYQQVRQHAQELEQTVAHRTLELTELYALSQKISFSPSHEEVLSLLVEHLQSALHDQVILGSLWTGSGWLTFVSTQGKLTPTALQELRSRWVEILQMICAGRSMPARDEMKFISTAEQPTAIIESLRSFHHALILSEDDPVGLLMIASQEKSSFRLEQIRLLETFSLQATSALQRITALRAEERRRLEDLVEHLPVGVLLIDDNQRLLLANPLGRTYLDLLKRNELVTDSQGLAPITDLFLNRQTQNPAEITLPGPPRLVFEVQVRAMGQDYGQWVVTLRDVTEERDNQIRIQMQERLATVGQLASGIAHDFNNIMAAILVYADLLMHDLSLNQINRERLDIIQQQVHRASSLIRQILDFSRRGVMEQSALDLLPFIKELDKMLGRVLPENIRLELNCRPGSYWVHADPSRLQQVFINLAVNARDAMPQGGSLRFEIDALDFENSELLAIPELSGRSWIRVAVSDSGTGIHEEVLPHIFEPFFTTKPVGKGTGLGLAQVYGIIKQHEGHIDVTSASGQGTTFNIYLPLYSPKRLEEKFNPAVQPPDGAGKMVLLVEDDPATREALSTLLGVHNYQVFAAENGLQALHLFERLDGELDLLVSDLVMPEMGGLALYQALQHMSPALKVLFVTGHPLEPESQAFLEQGQAAWLQKPFSVREFTESVKRLLA